MRLLLILAFYFLFCNNICAQNNEQIYKNPIDYINNFYKIVNSNSNSDSALFYAKKLASKKEHGYFLKYILHDNFAQALLEPKNMGTVVSNEHSLFCKELLMKMVADTTKLLQETARPMYLWTLIQDKKANISALSDLTTEFMKTQLASDDIYTNLEGRYGLLIHQIISNHEELKPLTEQLFAIIYNNLKNNQITLSDSTYKNDLMKRAWYRYLFAYANFIKATKVDDKEPFLKAAFDFSPDIVDKSHLGGFHYDKIFLLGDKNYSYFKYEYLKYLTNTTTDKSKILDLFLELALGEPEYKDKLEEFYNNTTKQKKFTDYWREAINLNAENAPQLLLQSLNKQMFSNKKHAGKWIFVDFWGTWCAPCRAEHPEIQKFYDSLILANPKHIAFLTIACRDKKEKVLAYLKENKFTFPVAMSNGEIEKIYKVQGYPTKILITPEGKYIKIPFGIDWVKFVKQYTSL